MKTKLKSHFLPSSYLQDCCSHLHNFIQVSISMEEYTRKFEKLLIKCDIQEPKDQTIFGYLRGLNPKYSNVFKLQ